MLRCYFLSFFILLVTFSPVAPKCLPRFDRDREAFKQCSTNVCFLFIEQRPFIIKDPSMNSINDQKIFRCKEHRKAFSQLEGVAFDIHRMLKFEALCVWAGDDCTFREMIEFVSNTFNNSETSHYLFGAQGMLPHLPDLLSPKIRATVTISQDPLIVVKSNQGQASVVGKMFHQVFRPFDPETWYAILGVILLSFVVSTIVTFVHSKSLSPIRIINIMRGESFDDFEDSNGTTRSIRRTTIGLVGTCLSILTLLSILFYEIGVVNYIFSGTKESLPKPLIEFNNQDLVKFGEIKGSASEQTLSIAVDPYGHRFSNGSFPWHRCKTLEMCFGKLLDAKDPLQYTIGFQPEALYNIMSHASCDKAVVLDTTSHPALSFRGSQGMPHGWYLSSSVSRLELQTLNKELLEIRLSGAIKNLTKTFIGLNGGTCEKPKLSIQADVLMLPIVLLVGPCILIVFAMLVYFVMTKREMEDSKDVEFNDVEAVLAQSLSQD